MRTRATARRTPLAPFALVGLLAMAACGTHATGEQAAVSFPDAPLLTTQSKGGGLNLAVRTFPQPPVRGVLVVRYSITDTAGAPANGLHLDVTPWMTAMGHGTSVPPAVMAHDGGVYDVSNVDTYMPGQWELRTTFSGTVNDKANPSFEVQ